MNHDFFIQLIHSPFLRNQFFDFVIFLNYFLFHLSHQKSSSLHLVVLSKSYWKSRALSVLQLQNVLILRMIRAILRIIINSVWMERTRFIVYIKCVIFWWWEQLISACMILQSVLNNIFFYIKIFTILSEILIILS